MKETTKTFLSVLFNPGEHIYAAPFGYTSKRNKAGDGWDFYYPSKEQSEVDSDKDLLCSINPLKGDTRNDENVTAFRTFLVEIDEGKPSEQKKYIEESGLPYSLCIFSGNKSMHFAITLDHDLPSVDLWRYFAEWILNTVPKADPNTKNPSRGIRMPGPLRPGKMRQVLVESRGRISLDKLMSYLNKHQDKRPKEEEKDDNFEPIKNNKFGMALWCQKGLNAGSFDTTKGRNQTWFSVGYEFGKNGYDYDTTVETVSPMYTYEATFTEREWKACLKNGHSKAVRKYWRKFN